jgi:hypothetical protein
MKVMLFMLLAGLCLACQKQNTTDTGKVQKKLMGAWKLTQVLTMMPNPKVPSVELRISKRQIAVLENGKQLAVVAYELVEDQNSVQLKTAPPLRIGTSPLRSPLVRMEAERLLLDDGMAYDGPGFSFERIK